MNNNLFIQVLSQDDLPAITDVHLAAFPDSALTKLGREAVQRYYEWQLIGPHDAVNIGCFAQEFLIGFCFGGRFRGALGGFLEKNRNFLIKRVVTHPWLLANSMFRERAMMGLKNLWKRMRPAQRKSKASQPTPPATPEHRPSFGILSIAVSPNHQGSGSARLLMEYSEQAALERGYTRMNLTVHPSNSRAIRFYEKMGWQRNEMNGVWSGHMSKVLETDPSE